MVPLIRCCKSVCNWTKCHTRYSTPMTNSIPSSWLKFIRHHLRKTLYSQTHITILSPTDPKMVPYLPGAYEQFSCKLITVCFCQQCRPSFRTKTKKVLRNINIYITCSSFSTQSWQYSHLSN